MYFVFGYDENADSGKGGERLFNLSRMKNLENTGRSLSPNSPPLPFCKNCTNLNKRIR